MSGIQELNKEFIDKGGMGCMKLRELLNEEKIKCLKMNGYNIFASQEGQFSLTIDAKLKAEDYMPPVKPWLFEKRLDRLRKKVDIVLDAEVRDLYIQISDKKINILVDLPSVERERSSRRKTDEDIAREKQEEEKGIRLMQEMDKNAQDELQHYNFPNLIGSDKQISWTASIRSDFFLWCKKYGINPEIMIEKETSAKFWIEHRNDISPATVEEYKKIQKYKEMTFEISMKPEKILHDGVVEIVEINNNILLFYKKDNDFIEIVKSNNFRWINVWTKESENIENDIDEIKTELLNNGYCVCVH